MKLKNIIYLSFIASICISCGIKTQEEIKRKELAAIDKVDNSSLNCELIEITENPKLDIPIDLAVSRDGDNVYVVRNINYSFPKVYRRNFIYKVNKNKKVEILKINGIPAVSCRYGFSIEKDDNNNLYVNDLYDNSIYQISEKEDKIKKILQIKEKPKIAGSDNIVYPEDVKPPPFILSGPNNLYIDNQDIYFAMDINTIVDGETQIKKFSDGKTETLFLTHDELPIFTVYNNEIFADFISYPFNQPINGPDLRSQNTKYIIKVTPPFIYPNYEKYDEPKRVKTIKLLGEPEDGKFQVDEMRVNSKGELFIADKDKNVIWKAIPSENKISIFAGNGKAGYKDGKGTNTQFSSPSGMDFDAKGNLYIADTGNNAIRKITADGTVTTFYSQSKN